MSTYTYRVIKSSWGILIKLSAEIAPFSQKAPTAQEVSEDLWLDVRASRMGEEERGHLLFGARLVSRQIREAARHDDPILILVTDVQFITVDFQPEGLRYAMAGWAAQELGFAMPQVDVSFDRPLNRYIFRLPEGDA